MEGCPETLTLWCCQWVQVSWELGGCLRLKWSLFVPRVDYRGAAVIKREISGLSVRGSPLHCYAVTIKGSQYVTVMNLFSLTGLFLFSFLRLCDDTWREDEWWFPSTRWCCFLNQRGVLGAAAPETFPPSGLRLTQDQLGRKRWQRAAVRILMQCIVTNLMPPVSQLTNN